ncbi:H(+)-transporting V1 sector ATPase subunit D [Puccinia graminis f. sp. tritici]|uniref:H(+)-transporting V1 sector ATPase subunit D n=1 Tax=Puccinia graminis f. sp. tritici TaxID=56615 RepID=A0A5B0MAQ7_PUCGR|nr:H(+)-transporting V1 sector ATPase subunit D [Puccinia graminis f. sp. tritici]
MMSLRFNPLALHEHRCRSPDGDIRYSRRSRRTHQTIRAITQKIDHTKREMGRVMQLAAFSLAEVTYTSGGDIGYQLQESVKEATFKVSTHQENVSGVNPAHLWVDRTKAGGSAITKAREIYAKATETLVELPPFRYYQSELDEGDREDFFRLKKVQAKKKERTAIAEAEKRERNAVWPGRLSSTMRRGGQIYG